jgi:hypothetical protein
MGLGSTGGNAQEGQAFYGPAKVGSGAHSHHSDSLQMSFGLLRVFSIVIPFLYVGTLISKNFAALLEEHDIFVPEDDDDDD